MATRAVILDEHTLGIIMGNDIQILRASVLRGSPIQGDPCSATGLLPIPMDKKRLRPATEKDFELYGVSSKGFFN